MSTSSPGPRPTPIIAAASALLPLAASAKCLHAEILGVALLEAVALVADAVAEQRPDSITLLIASISSSPAMYMESASRAWLEACSGKARDAFPGKDMRNER